MKQFFILLFLVCFSVAFSQEKHKSFGGEFLFNADKVVCVTAEHRQEIKKTIKENIERLVLENKIDERARQNPPKFIWPVQKSNQSDFFDAWAISFLVDHDSDHPDKLKDYNCGTKTYDTSSGYNHKGIDIYTWPFSFYQMDNDLSEVVAAATGTIIYKRDGEFDRSCNFNSNQWNAVYVRHDDGSVAWYGHLKKNSLTAKNVGDTVTAGEYLGIIGSSGNSTGPHLHFEVYDSDGNLIDPYAGSCNNMNSESWWQEQKPYKDSNINALITHSAPPVFNGCPETETVNIKEAFLPNERIYFASYFRDQKIGTSANYRLISPSGAVFTSWTKNFTQDYNSSYWYWFFTSLTENGTWQFECSYEGQTKSRNFVINSSLSVEEDEMNKITVFPNPFEDVVSITGLSNQQEEYSFTVYNSLGQQIMKKDKLQPEISLEQFHKGLYFLRISSENRRFKTFPILKK